MIDLVQVSARYRRFADEECKGYSDHYFRLARAVADVEELVSFLATMPVIQPNLFLAAVQFLTGPDDMPRTGEQMRAVVRERRDEVAMLMKSRRTQTNEVGRCATLLPAMPEGPIAIVEVGASAGLCLLMDEYFYDYGSAQVGNASSTVRLNCVTKGDPPIPNSLPQIEWRAGLDLNPVNVNNPDDARWLLSCVWPDHPARRERLAAAIHLAQSRELILRRGDLVADLSELLAEAPRDAALVVFHTAVLVYVSEEDRRTFANSLAEASRERDIVWISNESATVVLEVTDLAPPIQPSQKLLGRTRFSNGRRRDELLAVAHPHGAELKWIH